MVDRSVQSKRDLASCIDTDSLGPSSLGSQITSQIVRRELGYGGVVVCVLPNVLPDRVLGRAHG